MTTQPQQHQPARVVRDRMDDSLIDVPAGLAGVVAAETAIGDVRGLEGFYHYRQYSAVELATRKPFEDVWHLMIAGSLPTDAERERFAADVRAARSLPVTVQAELPAIAAATAGADSLAGLRAALALAAGAYGFAPLYDQDEAGRRQHAITVGAITPVLLATLHRARNGLSPIPPRDDLDHAANYYWMLTGSEPDQRQWHALNAYLISTIDHGFNASTFTARVIASTGADLGAAVLGALGSLSGPLHGGAPSRALDTLDAIGSPDKIDGWVRNAVGSGQRMMGFGHPIYRTEDPRSAMLKEIARGFGGARVDFAIEVERSVLAILAELKPGRALHTNVEFFAGVVMEACDIPREMFTPTFATGRMIGWTAHILEQAADSKIIRPSSRYVGAPPPQPFD
ncbi:citrate synthase/methylcitrate synthase [Microlunatus soli]|uniref:Citrate synthase n=1 Tax=Microlunatus soli TaxID=630515 RepID=A0A1H1WRT9_9ACTN|nr:citrate synthase/methylcitrate synthase [Microlunatus soli]SDS99371.1 citrate synthase [Microlunatus soli]